MRWTPEVLFEMAARSSFGQLNTQKCFSYADALRSGPSLVTKHTGSYDGYHATKYCRLHENDHENTGSKPEHGITAACSKAVQVIDRKSTKNHEAPNLI